MRHIPVVDRPGIRALFHASPQTAKPLCELAETLLGPTSQTLPGSTLSRGERELIAAFVSSRNACRYCTGSHSADAAAQLAGGRDLVEATQADGLATIPLADERGYDAMAPRIVATGYANLE